MAAGTTRNPWYALGVLCLANFLILLDTTIVNTALPDIMAALRTGIDSALWVLNGYLLAFASLLIVCGRLGDVLGPRRMFVAGLWVFTAASVLCGLSQQPAELVGARVVQGVGAAILLPQALVLIAAIFSPNRRGAAFGIFTATAGIAAMSGPTLGGLLVTELGWQSIFVLNLPAGLVGVALTPRVVPDLRVRRPHRFDLVGVLLATCGLFGVVYALTEGHGRRAGAVTSIAVSAVACLVLFVLWERRQPEPLVPLALFGNRNFGIATLITVVSSFALYGFLLVFVIETQSALGMSPLMSGIAALPMTVTLSALAPVAGRVTDRVGGRILLVIGLALFALGLLGVALLPAATSTAVVFVVPLIALGAGIGLSVAPTTTEAMRAVPPHQAGAASGVLNTARQIGAAFGAAVIGAVLQNRLAAALPRAALSSAARLPAPVRGSFVSAVTQAAGRGLRIDAGQGGAGVAPRDLPPDLVGRFDQLARDAIGHGFIAATRPTVGVVVAVTLLGSTLAGFMLAPERAGRAAVRSGTTDDRNREQRPETDVSHRTR